MASDERQQCINKIVKLNFSDMTMWYLLTVLERDEYSDIVSLLFSSLFGVPHDRFYKFVAKSKSPIGKLRKFDGGDIDLYGFRYRIAA